MAASLRRLAARIGLDRFAPARTAALASDSARYFARGYRYGRDMPPPEVVIPSAADATSPIEAYVDAHAEGPGIFKWKHYFDIYDRHLSRFRGQPVHVVEIGVAGGGSMQMWREYLGPDSHVCGIDIDPACRALEGEGVEICIGDQGDPAFWQRFLATSPIIDVVIDDGSHEPLDQVITLETLLPHVRPGGVYICEDIHGPFQLFHSFVDGLSRPLNEIGFPENHNAAQAVHRQVASVHRYPILTVIEKSAWCAPTFEAQRHGTQWPEGWDPRQAAGGSRVSG